MKILDEKGLTLMEVLAVLAITAIVLPVIYGVFHTGINLFNKIQIEGQIRDDADYAVSMMMNSFNSTPFDYVQMQGKSVQLVDSEQTAITENQKDNSTFYSYSKAKTDKTTTRSIEFVPTTVDGKTITSVSIDGKALESNGDFSNSEIKLQCSETDKTNSDTCLHGVIYVDFVINNEKLNKPLTLKSQFGF
ncbi:MULTISPECIES: type II secretion system protein J [Niallia]|uniref:Prepilin-type N-terminal cleavage/methylation domain-containing protein n=2 Tax=Niallia TaxID=2837506 RepID=A0A3S2UGJ8_9BACI|nr:MULTISPECIES: prepilin-type N-terminal cleavage/methylation domain-containing protein [Niallia]RVT65059.1 prepilin-type N-terminal cleavage/methylation domain-containing protein [Niallia taxi]TRZ37405.1 prepilin-type N-terminal cleavage/methylation domain-containing protein [Niallia circulans]